MRERERYIYMMYSSYQEKETFDIFVEIILLYFYQFHGIWLEKTKSSVSLEQRKETATVQSFVLFFESDFLILYSQPNSLHTHTHI